MKRKSEQSNDDDYTVGDSEGEGEGEVEGAVKGPAKESCY